MVVGEPRSAGLPAEEGIKPVFGKSRGGDLGPGGGGKHQGTDGECSRLPFVIWGASLSWYLGEGDLKVESERVDLLAAFFLSSAVGPLEGEKWACSYLKGVLLPPALPGNPKSCPFPEQCSWSPLGITLGILL